MHILLDKDKADLKQQFQESVACIAKAFHDAVGEAFGDKACNGFFFTLEQCKVPRVSSRRNFTMSQKVEKGQHRRYRAYVLYIALVVLALS